MTTLDDRYQKVLKKIDGRAKLIAVSKTRSIDEIRALYELGHRDFGENKVQELLEKSLALKSLDINWHFIGNLQKNKINQLLSVDGLKSIHSISSFELLQKLLSKDLSCKLNIFLQINTSLEQEKAGFTDQEQLAKCLSLFDTNEEIKVHGLMTIGRIRTTDFEKSAKECFSKLKQIKQNLDKDHNLNLNLSMGMSQDYEIAIDYGADYIRIGTQIFGPRV